MRLRLVIGGICVTCVACSLLTSTDGLVGGLGDGGTPNDAAPEASTNDAAPEVSTDAGGGDVSVDANEAGLPACPPVADPATVFVDAKLGDDTSGNGRDRPFKSITKALTIANVTEGTTICVRGGTASAPNLYSESSTGEVFPLHFKGAETVLLGEGQDRTQIAFEGAADAGVNSPNPGGNQPNTISIYVDDVAHDSQILGFTVKVSGASALYSRGVNLTVADTAFAVSSAISNANDIVAPGARALLKRVSIDIASVAQKTCVLAVNTTLTVEDSTFTHCQDGIFSFLRSSITVSNSKFTKCLTAIESHGAQQLNTTNNTFDTNEQFGVFVAFLNELSTPYSWISEGDTFVANRNGVGIYGPGGPAGSTVAIHNARFRLQTQNALELSSPLAFSMRGSTFEDNAGAAMGVIANGLGGSIDLGDADAGNVLQSTSHPNFLGLCLEGTGPVQMQNPGFAGCPPVIRDTCTKSGDIGLTDAGVVDIRGCRVIP